MATRVALIVDSTSDIPAALAKERGIYVIPLNIIWGKESLKDGVDIDTDTFYKRLTQEPELPKTSQPSPADFADLYHRARAETGADAVLAMTISSDLSGTYSSAEQAIKMVDFPAYAVDTRSVSMGLGLIGLEAADMRDADASIEEIIAHVQSCSPRARVLFTVNTLEYLHRGGRIGGAKYMLGTALSIKPILHIKDGRIDALESVRTRKRAVNRLVELFGETIGDSVPKRVFVLHTCAEQEAEAVKAEIQERWHPEEISLAVIGATVGSHVGPGLVGFTILV